MILPQNSAEIFQSDIDRVKVGNPASVTVNAYPDQTFPARLSFIWPEVDQATRRARVRLEIPNPELKLLVGMFVNVMLDLPLGDQRFFDLAHAGAPEQAAGFVLPAHNDPGAPANMTQQIASLASASRSARVISTYIASVSAFFFSGRLIGMMRTAPSSIMTIGSGIVPLSDRNPGDVERRRTCWQATCLSENARSRRSWSVLCTYPTDHNPGLMVLQISN